MLKVGTEYKKRHDKAAIIVHWELCKKHNLPHTKNWYDYQADAVAENAHVKFLWNFNARTDRVTEAGRPDIRIIDKRNKMTLVSDVAIPRNFKVKDNKQEKVTKYQNLIVKVQRMWDTKQE